MSEEITSSDTKASATDSSSNMTASNISTDSNLSAITIPSGSSYKCRFCGLHYNYMTTLRAHERVHDIDEPYKCATCGFAFRFNAELEAHNLEHTRSGKDLYKCGCGRKFVNYSDLLWHKHPGEDDEEIQRDKEFERLPPLQYSSRETVRTPYHCQFCAKSYANPSDLKNHLYGHRGERAFSTITSSRKFLRYQ